MDVNLETFMALEKQSLREDRERLSARSNASNAGYPSFNSINNFVGHEGECAAIKILQNNPSIINEMKCNRSRKCEIDKINFQQTLGEEHQNVEEGALLKDASVSELPTSMSSTQRSVVNSGARTESSMATAIVGVAQQSLPPTSHMMGGGTFDFYREFAKENVSSATSASINGDGMMSMQEMQEAITLSGLSKTQKDFANQQETKTAVATNTTNEDKQRLHGRRKKDDMEQWVSDTFYSYFPGYNNENQKRQNYLRDRQLEYQQNFLRHQMLHPPLGKHAAHKSLNSNATAAHATHLHSAADKTDLEIIVNNPNYAPKYTTINTTSAPRPGSTRHKLLQDLQHTEISHFSAGDGASERNRQSAEIELARKKDYQRELLQQIEEKRRSIEVLHEQERRQEAVLTRRLQEQLKTIQLAEELEKEKLRAEKLRFDTEQNRLMREQLLAKLENDRKLLFVSKTKNSNKDKPHNKERQVTAKSSASDGSHQDNKVYKYFSNSARHEYRRGKPLPADVELDLDIPDSLSTPPHSQTERECFHLSEKVCPMCDAPLKNYESCCLRCQRKLSLKIERKPDAAAKNNEQGADANTSASGNGRSYSLVCSKCERLYALCPSCLERSDVCRACHRQRNVCMNCRRTLCSFCLEEIACGRDVERCHVNDEQDVKENKVSLNKNDPNGSERSFQVIEVNYAAPKSNNDFQLDSPPQPLHANNLSYNNNNNNSNNIQNNRPPYSMNIERNSIFHPNYEPQQQLPKVIDKNINFDQDSTSTPPTDENVNMERVRKETDKRVSRYFKNYGDLAKYSQARSQSESRDRSTQTTPIGSARRDVVLHEEHNLSMPLLREMPKMTRQETTQLLEKAITNKHRMMDNLKRRWEIPAVQKYSISPTSPPVLTQVGAIRKQLQADRLLLDDY